MGLLSFPREAMVLTFHLIAYFRDRPAPIPIEVKSIDDTSNFDEFPDLDMNFVPSGNGF